MTLIRQTRDDQIVDARCRIELNENHVALIEHWNHAVTGDLERDISPRRNIVGQLQPAVTRLVPDLATSASCHGEIQQRRGGGTA